MLCRLLDIPTNTTTTTTTTKTLKISVFIDLILCFLGLSFIRDNFSEVFLNQIIQKLHVEYLNDH